MSAFVNDGYTFHGHVDAFPRIHDSFTFIYRIALPEDIDQYFADTRSGNGKDIQAAKQKVLTVGMVSWDLKDKVGNLAPCRFDKFKVLHHRIIETLVGYILGYTSPDAEPEASGEKNVPS